MTSRFEPDRNRASGMTVDLAGPAAAIEQIAGCDHVTLLALESGGRRLRRIYSSAPDLFPVRGTKPAPKRNWLERIVKVKRPVLYEGTAEIRSVFQDHERILGLDIDAILNIPVIRADRCVGTVNCLYRVRPAPEAVQPIARSVGRALDGVWK